MAIKTRDYEMTTLKKGEGIGKELSPTVRLGVKARQNRIKELNEMSRQSLERIQNKYKSTIPKRKYAVDSNLRLVVID